MKNDPDKEDVSMYTCADCTIVGCQEASKEGINLPKNCPMRQKEMMDAILDEYREPETNHFYRVAGTLEADGYGVWPRLKEIIEFCKRMEYKNVGMAFCGGLRKEAQIVAQLFRKHGIHLETVVCKAGGYDKCEVGVADNEKIHPGEFEPLCNPIAQAKLLNDAGCEFNIVLGLCVGHDSLFMANSKALCTVLAVKDRALGNNPIAAIYTAHSYCRNKL